MGRQPFTGIRRGKDSSPEDARRHGAVSRQIQSLGQLALGRFVVHPQCSTSAHESSCSARTSARNTPRPALIVNQRQALTVAEHPTDRQMPSVVYTPHSCLIIWTTQAAPHPDPTSINGHCWTSCLWNEKATIRGQISETTSENSATKTLCCTVLCIALSCVSTQQQPFCSSSIALSPPFPHYQQYQLTQALSALTIYTCDSRLRFILSQLQPSVIDELRSLKSYSSLPHHLFLLRDRSWWLGRLYAAINSREGVCSNTLPSHGSHGIRYLSLSSPTQICK
jgi:hypothetical protein